MNNEVIINYVKRTHGGLSYITKKRNLIKEIKMCEGNRFDQLSETSKKILIEIVSKNLDFELLYNISLRFSQTSITEEEKKILIDALLKNDLSYNDLICFIINVNWISKDHVERIILFLCASKKGEPGYLYNLVHSCGAIRDLLTDNAKNELTNFIINSDSEDLIEEYAELELNLSYDSMTKLIKKMLEFITITESFVALGEYHYNVFRNIIDRNNSLSIEERLSVVKLLPIHAQKKFVKDKIRVLHFTSDREPYLNWSIENMDLEFIFEDIKVSKFFVSDDIIDKLVDKVIDSKNSGYIYKFYKENILSRDNVKKLINAIMELKDVEKIYLFIFENISYELRIKLINAIINIKSAEYMYLIAENVSGLKKADINALVTGLTKTNDAFYMYKFLKEVKPLSEENITKLINGIIKSKNAEYILKVSEPNENLLDSISEKNIVQGICKTKSAEHIYNFALHHKELDKIDLTHLTEAIANTNSGEYIYKFAKNVDNLDHDMISLLLNGVIKSKDAKYIYYFAKLNGLSNNEINKLGIAISKGYEGDERFIYEFAKLSTISKDTLNLLIDKLIKIPNCCDLLEELFSCINHKQEKQKIIDTLLKKDADLTLIRLLDKELDEENIEKIIDFLIKKNMVGMIYGLFEKKDYKMTMFNKSLVDKMLNLILKTEMHDRVFKLAEKMELDDDQMTMVVRSVINTKDIDYIYKFAKDIKNISSNNMLALVRGLLQVNNLSNTNMKKKTKVYDIHYVETIYFFARNIENLEHNVIKELLNGLLNTNNAEYIYNFARDVRNLTKQDMDEIVNKIASIKDSYYIISFAQDFMGLSKENIDALVDGIINTGDIKGIYTFLTSANDLDDIQKMKLINFLLESNLKFLVAAYILEFNENKFITELFGNKTSFINYCDANTDNIKKNKFLNSKEQQSILDNISKLKKK